MASAPLKYPRQPRISGAGKPCPLSRSRRAHSRASPLRVYDPLKELAFASYADMRSCIRDRRGVAHQNQSRKNQASGVRRAGVDSVKPQNSSY